MSTQPAAPAAPATATPEASAETPAQEQATGATQTPEQDSTDWKAEARKWEARAKENASKATEFEKQRKAAMTDAERAIAEAEERGRTTATTQFGEELARERFDSLAGRRNPDFDTAKALEFVDLRKFVGEDGRPDSKAITAAVERLVPAVSSTPPSFDGGSRTPAATGASMSDLIRKATGRA